MTDDDYRAELLARTQAIVTELRRVADALERVSPALKIIGTPRQSDIADLIAPTLKDLADAERKDRQEARDGAWREPQIPTTFDL